ncbi:MATE family efflux transporter [Candidatus Hydrogenedentota bacterium]
MKSRAQLTSGPVGRTLFFMTAPMVVGLFAITAFHLADTLFVARLGTKELAAISFTFPVVMFTTALALGLGVGTASVLSRAIGEEDPDKMRRLATDSLILSFLVVVVFIVIGLFTITPLFTLLGAPAEMLPLIRRYMTIWYIGMAFLVIPIVGNNIIRATGDTLMPSLIMIFGAGVNVVLDPILIFGLWGFPRLELAGAAIATVIGRALTMALALSILHFRERMLDFSIPGFMDSWDSWKRILYVGVPSAATYVLTPISAGVITRLAASLGTAKVAAFGAGGRVEALALLPLTALASILVPFIGQNWGAKRLDRVQAAKKCAHGFAFLWGMVLLATFLVTRKHIADLITEDAEVAAGIALYLLITPVARSLFWVCRLSAATLNAVNRPLAAASISIMQMFVFYVPLAYVGSRYFGFAGMLAGGLIGNIIAAASAMTWTSQPRLRRIASIEE